MGVGLTVLLGQIRISIGNHLHPTVRDVFTLGEDMLDGPYVLFAFQRPQIDLGFAGHAAFFKGAEYKATDRLIVFVDRTFEAFLELLITGAFCFKSVLNMTDHIAST